MDEGEVCGDYTCTQEWHVKEDGTRTLVEEVLEQIPGAKRMGVWAGTHVEIQPEAILQASQFLARTLA